MASTSQTALEYLSNARVHLVGKLRNHLVILENLYQKGVLHDEEVNKIKTEKDDYDKNRALLDSVIKKGEASCYQLLRILYETRRRTLERPGSDETTAKEFNLHQWICCFSFKEEAETDTNYLQGSRPCHRYQSKLKSKGNKLSRDFWKASNKLFQNQNPDLSYTPLVLDTNDRCSPSKIKKYKTKKSKLSRPKKLRAYIPEDIPEISPTRLLKMDKDILLVGKPGTGKTALSHEMLRLWSERDDKELDYMFYFDMREMTNIPLDMSLEDLLFNCYSKPDEGRDEILEDIERNSENVTIILDGVTDLSSSVMKKLVEKDLLSHAKIIITCRPDDEEDLCLEDWFRVEVKGFSEGTIKTYLSKALGEDHQEVLSNVELLTLSHVPMYALMVAASFSSGVSLQPKTVTEIYINIVRFSLQMNSNGTRMKNLNQFIRTKRDEIMSLAEAAFEATQRKTVNLEGLSFEDSCILSFRKSLDVKVALTETMTVHAFLHYTMQEFFAALWLLKNPEKIREVFQQSLTEEMKHMKHVIPFMCQLLNEENPSLMSCLVPDEKLVETQEWFFKEMIDTFFQKAHDSELYVDTLFLCQCLYESQSSEACIAFLDKLNFHLDLSGENLDPHSCQAVAFMVTQSKERKISLNLKDVTVSEQGMRQLLRCLQHVKWCDSLPQQLWRVVLLSNGQTGYKTLLDLCENQLHLSVVDKKMLFENAVKVMQREDAKVTVCLHWVRGATVCQSLSDCLLQALPKISNLRFDPRSSYLPEQTRFLVNLFCAAAEREQLTGEKMVELLASVCRYETFIIYYEDDDEDDDDDTIKYPLHFLLDLYSQMKDCETKTGLSLLPSLQSVFQSAPPVWIIKLSEIQTSILLEVLKLQSEKKPVKLTDCSHGESEVRSFLQCLPYISQLRFDWSSDRPEQTRFLVNLFCAAAEREQLTGEKMVELLASVCRYETFIIYYQDDDEDDDDDHIKYRLDFLLDLYFQMKDCETKTGLSLLPSLQSVFQSAPPEWTIDLSERKTSILLEVLKLQSEKKPVKLTDCSHGESEVRSFLQCLPYISQLRFDPQSSYLPEQTRFLVNLFCAAAEREQLTGEKMVELLASVCRYETFPLEETYMEDGDVLKYQSHFLLDLYSQMKDCETKTGLSLLPSLQSVFQSAPPVWIIKLSEIQTSILLEVLKLQSEKKPVELTDCSHGESEVRSFLQWLPYISKLRFYPQSSDLPEQTRFLVNLFCAAAEREQLTGEKMVELLASVCRYETFPFYGINKYQSDILLDLYSQMKDCETKTGLSLLPSLQSVFQSAPPEWTIKLSEIQTSILLEVLKLQSEKKPVKLTDCSHGESEVRSFLQCLPYISQLSCDPGFFQIVCSSTPFRSREEVQQLVSLLQLLNFNLRLTGELGRKTCSPVGRVLRLCGSKVDLILTARKMSVRGASVLFRSTTQLHSLRLSNAVALFLSQWVRRGRVTFPLVVEELSVVSTTAGASKRALLKVGSSLASLLRFWTVRRLDLTKSRLPTQSLFSLLLHDAPLSVRLSEDVLQQLVFLLHEVQDQDLTLSFLKKVGGDLSSCRLKWEMLHYLLQQPSDQTITVNLKKNSFLQERAPQLLPFLHRMVLQRWRPRPSFVRTSIREISRALSSHMIPALLRSLDHVIDLNCTELDSEDCAALLFILRHSDGVKLKLLWSSIPAEGIQSILHLLHKVSDLSVDRKQLLSFIHCCAASDSQQEAAAALLRTLQHSVDLSCSSCVELAEEEQKEPLRVTAADCRAVSSILRHSSRDTQLHLRDCEVEDSGLDLLFPVLDRVRLRVSKTVLVQLLSLLTVGSERDTVRRAVSLCRALGGELDLSHSTLDQRLCAALVLMLDYSEGLTELDLSHCQLTDLLLLQLITHLHKVKVLDLSHNQITDASTDQLLLLVSINPSIGSVRLFNNNILNRTPYKDNRKFEMW
ncbi:uncharacterized protein LOC119794668 isoform X6 [Cyprinodon tularosa]|uniref:uncharacterized protein LOC119794668 isoform X6 n=1 Tax=Cyprinodon tularosa TaxID=77115 RepID=UPI0018E28CFE|nr:uncharacterized protein LOC119794668 isoform X6 [Cyprinodon tularosa]